ncbi:hypothetical protein JKP88DRAFT_204837 [Tribonema minus]|uniref:BZIP domain-containing protein n=1 Tax=Tribonema minus TaxID=303371 RepID=A0A836CN81_9STRA|nr:hypothetical protein JKP88DRAFT_204837 [Tribonema minus]
MLGAASLLQQQAQLLQQQQQQSIAGAPLRSPGSGHSRGGGDNDGCSDSEEEYGFSMGDALTEDNLAHRDGTEAPPPANSGGRKGAKAGKHAATSDDGSGAPTARRGQMSMDEKAEASRDRNRKHARNTRLRKKAYIEELERTVQQLTAERDAAAAAKAAEGARAAQLQSVRFSVLQMALFYRAAGNTCRADWATALEESFTCVLPITPYRSFPSAEVVSGQRMIVGIDAMIADVASLALMVESVGRCRPSERRVQVQYYAGPEDAITSGDMLSCRWMLRTENAAACGALCECHAQGMLRARYSPSHKLAHLELAFDVMGFMQQLQRASGLEDFRVVPNTLAMAQAPCDADARFITTAEPPYLIVHASPAWCRLCGYASEEAVGRTAALLQGPATDRAAVARFMGAVRARHCCSMEVVNYTKAGVPFANYIVAYPLSTDGRVTHYLATISAAAKPPPPAAATVAAVSALAAPAPAVAATALLPQGGLAMSVMPPLGAGATLPQIMPNGGSGGAAAGVAATGFRRRKTEVVTPLPTPAAPPLGWQ